MRPCAAKSVYRDFFSAPFFTFSFKFCAYSVCVGSSIIDGADAPDAAVSSIRQAEEALLACASRVAERGNVEAEQREAFKYMSSPTPRLRVIASLYWKGFHHASPPLVPARRHISPARRGMLRRLFIARRGFGTSRGGDVVGAAASYSEGFSAVRQAVQFGALCWCIDRYVLHVTTTEGPSMLPTLRDAGDVVVVEKLTPRFSAWAPIRRGDIVVADSSYRAAYTVCKRVVALEGDAVVLRDGQRTVVPRGHVWIEGDNPQDSTDSRAYGPISTALVRGRVVARVWPLHDARFFDASEPRPSANWVRLRELEADATVRARAAADAEARAARAAAAARARAAAEAETERLRGVENRALDLARGLVAFEERGHDLR
jgi:inner membrane protease subunit 1